MTSRLASLVVKATLVLAASDALAAAPQYKTTVLDFQSAFGGQGVHINNKGQVTALRNLSSSMGEFVRVDVGSGTITSLSAGSFEGGALNDLGEVGGSVLKVDAVTGERSSQAAIWSPTGSRLLTVPSSSRRSSVEALSNSGFAVGNFADHYYAGSYQAVLWDPSGNMTVLPGLEGNKPTVKAVNEQGVAAGAALTDKVFIDGYGVEIDPDGGNVTEAVIWQNGQLTELEDVSLVGARANAINNALEVVGVGYGRNPVGDYVQIPILWVDRKAILLPTGQRSAGSANAINEAGDVVGRIGEADSAYKDETSRGVLWRDGELIDLHTFMDASLVADGWVFADARDISEQGEILGYARKSVGGREMRMDMVLTPVPEPGAVAMAMVGLGLVLGRRRRHRMSHRRSGAQ